MSEREAGLICGHSVVGALGADAVNGAVTRRIWGRAGSLTEGLLFDQLRGNPPICGAV